jgi:hypothetical protein
MKKILFLSNLVWILITTLMITHATRQPGKALASPEQTPPPNCIPGQVNGMNANFFLKGLARYRKYQLSAINEKLSSDPLINRKFEDARSCWYSIDTLKKFICLIEQNANKNGWDPATSDLGIRFYYAAYSDTEHQTIPLKVGPIFRPAEVNVGMHHTLFMVPTHHVNETNLEEDLYLKLARDAPRENKKLIIYPPWETYMKSPQLKLLILGQPVNTVSSKNQGMLCPPNCPTDAESTLNRADALTIDVH